MITTASDGTKMIECGYGTVGTSWHFDNNVVTVLISEIPMVAMGSNNYNEPNEHEVEISFCNVNSVDIWIDSLNRAKAMLQGKSL